MCHFCVNYYINLRTEFPETVKEAKIQALGQVMKACESAGTSFFGRKCDVPIRVTV